MNCNDFAKRISSMQEKLVATISEVDSHLESDNKLSGHVHAEIRVIMFDGSWMGEIYPWLIKFPFGETVVRHGASGEDLEALLINMEKLVDRQLDNTKMGMIDTIPS